MMSETITDEKIKDAVRQTYGDIARRFVEEPAASRAEVVEHRVEERSCCGPSPASSQEPTQRSCCGPAEAPIDVTGAARFYPTEELAGLPDSVTEASLG